MDIAESLSILHAAMGHEIVLAIPTYVRQWRKYRKLSQAKLAELAGLSTPTISQLEAGKQGFTHESLAAIAKALGCSPAELLVRDPRRDDSFWPLFEAAEKLDGRERRQLRTIIASMIDPDAHGSK